LRSRFTGIGGHNLLPADDSPTAAAVMVSPGGPAHVMLNDRIAEHIPGCNMAFYRWALREIGGFNPIYRKAGDDVDICWRLQQRGYQIGFSSAGFVWHYRRNTIAAYLKQQTGYGEAESLLERRHPENFNRFGGSMWHGRIYPQAGDLPRHLRQCPFPKHLHPGCESDFGGGHESGVPRLGHLALACG
jgi:GT2 family glycosyltransferase